MMVTIRCIRNLEEGLRPEVAGQIQPFVTEREFERGLGFSLPGDQMRCVMSRYFLRAALSAELGLPPRAIEIVEESNGKPRLGGSHGSPTPCYFNVSHAHDRIAIAISRRCPVGIDIEAVRSLPDIDELAAEVLTADEINWMVARGAQARLRSFFTLWTRKEAMLKAVGCGLSVRLRTIDVMPTRKTAHQGLGHAVKVRSIFVSGDFCASVACVLSPV